jgi:hypothetical protein
VPPIIATSLTDPSLFRLPLPQQRATKHSIHPRTSALQHFSLRSSVIPIHRNQPLKIRLLEAFLRIADLNENEI